ncbi:MAG: PepSY-like domain-containing protein [Maribacter sp.]|nr:PepSY-like domain-containing protein [Maribacter sp.]
MKSIKNITILFTILIVITSCSKNSQDAMNDLPAGTALKADAKVKVGDLPQPILDYVTTNYPELTITKSEQEDNGHFEVKLSNHTELIFDAAGTFIGIDDDNSEHDDYGDSNIAPADLLPAILAYIETNYAEFSIEEASMENNGHIEVTLNDVDKTVLIFNANGEFMGVGVDENDQDGDGEYEWGHGDHHDDGDNIDPAQLPDMALAYLSDTYPDLDILHAELESEGTYEVTMSNGLEVYFDAEGNFVSTDD